MNESDRRASARRHTAKLLKMLRGYGPKESLPAAENRAVVTKLANVRSAFSSPSPQGEGESDPSWSLKASPLSTLKEEEKSVEDGQSTTASSKPAMVADTKVSYIQWTEAPPDRPSLTSRSHSLQRSLIHRSIPSVGESLHQQPGVLGQLMMRVDQWAQSSRIFQAYLPPHLREHVVLVRMDEEAWTVRTDSASWATRLRYKLYDIRQMLGQQLGIALPKPHIRVEPAMTSFALRRRRLTLTQESARLLKQTAHNEPDPRLSAALLRLAQHTDPEG
ncbi:MAG: DUF721 domain-containing protein [Gammaproteobacteria bacterium]|nr:DUF721 domain-containing protein [Gammaproteobacteria bacterium]